MRSPFPGMDPYLEHPSLWPDVHNSFVAAIRVALARLVAPKYFVALERRTYALFGDDLILVGRPDITVSVREHPVDRKAQKPNVQVLEVSLPASDEVTDTYLVIREASHGEAVTVIELLSPGNKLHSVGRAEYLEKRTKITRTLTSLVEIDLLRAGEPMPVIGSVPAGGYRILVSRSSRRPRAQLSVFGVRDALPSVPIPLAVGDPEPVLELGMVWHELYEAARFDLQVDYRGDPVPPLDEPDRAWARARVAASS